MTTSEELFQVFELVQAPVNVLLETIRDQHYDICMMIDWYDMQMAKGLRFKPRSTREKCEEAAKVLEQRFKKNLQEQAEGLDHIEDYDGRLRPLYRSYQEMKRKVMLHPLFKKLHRQRMSIGVTGLAVDFYAPEGEDSIRELEANERLYPNMCFPYREIQLSKNSVLFQDRLRLLMSKLPSSVQQELLTQWIPKHPVVLELTKTKPDVEVELRQVRCLEGGVKTTPLRLPLEVMGVLYSVADLETCVALREVSSKWYTAFKMYGDNMMNAVKSRTLGLTPGENGCELQSWGDCALVFVGRLRNSKWEKVEEEDRQARSSNRILTPTHTLVPIDIDAKLPSDYTGLVNEPLQLPDNTSTSNVNQNWYRLGGDYALNPQTLKFHKVPEQVPGQFSITYLDNDIVCVEYEDSSFTIPNAMKLFTEIVSNHEALVFCCGETDTGYILPRQFPDFRQGHGFAISIDSYDTELTSHAFRIKTSSFEAPIVLQKKHHIHDHSMVTCTHTYSVLDLHNSRAVVMISDSDVMSTLYPEPLAAQFNGLIWREKHFGGALLPYFVDLDSGTWYHNRHVSIHTKTGEGWKQASESCNARRFVYRGREGEDLEIVDLATRCVINVKSLGNTDETVALFPGFSEGRLGVWSYNEKTQRRYSRYLDQLREIDPDQDEYDVSGAGVE